MKKLGIIILTLVLTIFIDTVQAQSEEQIGFGFTWNINAPQEALSQCNEQVQNWINQNIQAGNQYKITKRCSAWLQSSPKAYRAEAYGYSWKYAPKPKYEEW